MRLTLLVLALAVAPVALAAPERPNDYKPLPTISAPSTVSRIEGRLSAAATRIVGGHVELRCWGQADWTQLSAEWLEFDGRDIYDWAAYSDPQVRRAHLAPATCAEIVPFLYRGARPKVGTRARTNLAHSLVTIAHEAQHVAGIKSEAQAECFGQQRVRPLARMLGASKEYSAGLAVHAWRVLYRGLPANYRSSRCRNGGPWDLNPAASSWP